MARETTIECSCGRGVTIDDLRNALGVVAEFEIMEDRIQQTPSSTNLGPKKGVRRKGNTVQFGLTDREIKNSWAASSKCSRKLIGGKFR